MTILEGAVDIVPQQVVASGQAEFGLAWVPKVLASRAEGADLVNIGQVFQRSGTLGGLLGRRAGGNHRRHGRQEGRNLGIR